MGDYYDYRLLKLDDTQGLTIDLKLGKALYILNSQYLTKAIDFQSISTAVPFIDASEFS